MAIPGIMRSATAAKETEIYNLCNDITKYCTGDEMEIRNLNMLLTCGNRRFYSQEKITDMELRLHNAELNVTTTRTPIEQRIEALRQEILLISARQTEMEKFILSTLSCPTTLLPIIDQYVQSTSG